MPWLRNGVGGCISAIEVPRAWKYLEVSMTVRIAVKTCYDKMARFGWHMEIK